MNSQAGVYVISDGCGHVKIGVARDPEKRLRELQVGNANKLRVIGHFWCDRPGDSEAAAHRELDYCRARGEWFGCGIQEACDVVRATLDSEREPLSMVSVRIKKDIWAALNKEAAKTGIGAHLLIRKIMAQRLREKRRSV